MPTVRFPPHLTSQIELPASCEVPGQSVKEVLQNLERMHPGVCHYLLDDQGSLRKHVNIFIGNEWITDRKSLSDTVKEQDEIYCMQALSGG